MRASGIIGCFLEGAPSFDVLQIGLVAVGVPIKRTRVVLRTGLPYLLFFCAIDWYQKKVGRRDIWLQTDHVAIQTVVDVVTAG